MTTTMIVRTMSFGIKCHDCIVNTAETDLSPLKSCPLKSSDDLARWQGSTRGHRSHVENKISGFVASVDEHLPGLLKGQDQM